MFSRLLLRQAGMVFLLLLLVLYAGGGAPAFAWDLSALWEYGVSGGENVEVQDSLKQVYKAGTGFAVDPTRAISVGANIGYNWRDISTGKGPTDTLTPGATLRVNNDIFNFNFAGASTITHSSGGGTFDTTRWETFLSPASYPWNRDYWPGMSVHYGESKSTSPGGNESLEYTYGANVNWALPKVFQVFYGYDGRRNENNWSSVKVETITQDGRFTTGHTFWDGLLNVKFGQGITLRSAKTTGIVPESGVVAQEFDDLQTFKAEDQVIGSPYDTHDLTLNPEAELGNRQTNTTTYSIIAPGQRLHLGLRVLDVITGLVQKVDQLHIYVDPVEELVTQRDALQWDVYAGEDIQNPTIDDEAVRWYPLPDGRDVAANYNIAEQRFEIKIPAHDQDLPYLKVVISIRSGAGVNEVSGVLRAVKGAALTTAPPGSTLSRSDKSTSYSTNAVVGIRLSSTLTASSNLNMQYGEGYFNGLLHGNLNWRPSPWVFPSLGFSETRRQATGTPDAIVRNYSLNVPMLLMPTFNVNLGTSVMDTFEGDRKKATQDSYLLGISATLYPDLTASLIETYNTGRSQQADGTEGETEDFAANLTLKANLTRKLLCELSNRYHKILKPEALTLDVSTLNLYYRPSDYLSMQLGLDKNFAGNGQDSQEFVMSMALLRSRKTRVNFNSQLTHKGNEDVEKFFGLIGSWDISKIFTLKSQVGYSIAETTSWNILTSLYMRL
jgi:hypothetical protein